MLNLDGPDSTFGKVKDEADLRSKWYTCYPRIGIAVRKQPIPTSPQDLLKADNVFLKHEWDKHGTCTGWEAHEYFDQTVKLFDEVVASMNSTKDCPEENKMRKFGRRQMIECRYCYKLDSSNKLVIADNVDCGIDGLADLVKYNNAMNPPPPPTTTTPTTTTTTPTTTTTAPATPTTPTTSTTQPSTGTTPAVKQPDVKGGVVLKKTTSVKTTTTPTTTTTTTTPTTTKPATTTTTTPTATKSTTTATKSTTTATKSTTKPKVTKLAPNPNLTTASGKQVKGGKKTTTTTSTTTNTKGKKTTTSTTTNKNVKGKKQKGTRRR